MVGIPNVLKILDELEIGIRDCLHVLDAEAYSSVGVSGTSLLVTLSLELCQRKCCVARVSNLATVPPSLGVVIPIVRDETGDHSFVDFEAPVLVRKSRLHQPPIELEDPYGRTIIKFRIVEANMNAG